MTYTIAAITTQANATHGSGTAVSVSGDVLRSGGVVVDLDVTMAAQVVLFVLLFLVLKPLLFTPMLRLFEEREKRTEGAKSAAKQMYVDADAKMAKYEQELERVKRDAGADRDKLRSEGARAEQAILAKVRAETNELVEAGRSKTQKESQSLRAELQSQSGELARTIASKVLGREIAS